MDEREERVEPGEPPAEAGPSPRSDVDLAQVRDLILQANPDVVPEMVAGNSFDEMMATVASARAAYQRIAESVKVAQPAPPSGTSGQPARQASVINIEELGPSAKIAEGLKRRRTR